MSNDLLENFSGMRLVMLIMLQKHGGSIEITNEDLENLKNLGDGVKIEPGVTERGTSTFRLVKEDGDGNVTPV